MGDRPCIEVWSRDAREDWVREILAGAEEEGVWLCVTPCDSGDADSLAQSASSASALGIGVGLHRQQAVVWIEALHRFNPLMRTEIKTTERARELGANAARYIKGTPLKAGGWIG